MASAPSSHRPVGGSRRDRLVDSGGGSGDDVISSFVPAREAGVGSGTNRTPTQSGRKKVGSVVGHVTDLLAKNFGVKTSASTCVASEKQPPAQQQLLCPSGSPTGCGTTLFATPGSSSRPPPSPRPVQTASATVRPSQTSGGNATPVVNSDTVNSLPAADLNRAFFYVPTATDSNLRSDQQQLMSSTDSGIGGLTSGHFPVPDDSRRSSSLSGPVSSSPPTSSASSASSSSPSAGANSPSRTGGSRGGGRSRFKKFLRPLRRTRSAGSGEDLNNPVAHAQHFGLPGPFGRRAASTKATSLTPPSLSRSSVPSTGSDDTDSPQLRSPDGGNSSESEGEESVSPPLSSLNIKETQQTNAGPKYGPRDIRRKFSWLRRHSDSAQNDGSMCMEDTPSGGDITNLPSRDSLRLWAESLDQLLADEYGQNLFREFLRSEFSEENLDFWLACERYRTSESTESLPTLAKDIYSDFVVAKAPREINLDCTTRQQTAVGILTPDRTTFQPAQKRIQALMERDPYRRFLESDVYLRLMAGSKPVSAVQSQTVSASTTVTSSPSRSDPTVRQPTGLGVGDSGYSDGTTVTTSSGALGLNSAFGRRLCSKR